MIKAILVARRDEQTGELGLCLEDMRGMTDEVNSATEGLLIAHDLIEHVNGPEEIGTIGDELEALGAIWYVRGQHGELLQRERPSRYSVSENIASDVTRMFRDWFYQGCPQLSYCPLTRPVKAESEIEETLIVAGNTYKGEFNEDEDKRRIALCWKQFRAESLVRMRRGYSKARRRWERYGSYAANNAFWAIAEAVQPYCKHPEFEGMQYRLVYTRQNGATCKPLYDEDGY